MHLRRGRRRAAVIYANSAAGVHHIDFPLGSRVRCYRVNRGSCSSVIGVSLADTFKAMLYIAKNPRPIAFFFLDGVHAMSRKK